jgi:sorbose reductase
MPPPSERDALTSRILPQMVLSKGDANSMTAPPPAIPQKLVAEDRVKARFEVRGNAMYSSQMMMEEKANRYSVTGGAGTLGFAAARALLEHGLKGLMIFDVNPIQAEAKIEELQEEFPAAIVGFSKVDITDEVAVEAAVVETARLLGSVDILLCFAGVVGCTHAIDMTAAEWRRTLDINATGSFLCAQAAAKQMIKQGTGGGIVFTASISGHRVNFPQPQVAYNVSKSAVLALKNSLAAEWARYGIRVNSISPGYMDTILNEGDGIAEGRAIWASRNPMGRMGVPHELTGAVVLLASSVGSYINGKQFTSTCWTVELTLE